MSQPGCVRLFVCGNPDRGDDAAAIVAVQELLPHLPPDLATRLDVRWCGQLEVEDLLELPQSGACVIVDTVVGIPEGSVAVIPLAELEEHAELSGATPRSSHIMPIDQLLAIAEVLRDAPIEGVFVGLGGGSFALGSALDVPVQRAEAAFQHAIADALSAVAGGSTAGVP